VDLKRCNKEATITEFTTVPLETVCPLHVLLDDSGSVVRQWDFNEIWEVLRAGWQDGFLVQGEQLRLQLPPTSTTTGSVLSPTMTRTTTSCTVNRLGVSGDRCYDLAARYGVSLAI
jgi:hypothetical protein